MTTPHAPAWYAELEELLQDAINRAVEYGVATENEAALHARLDNAHAAVLAHVRSGEGAVRAIFDAGMAFGESAERARRADRYGTLVVDADGAFARALASAAPATHCPSCGKPYTQIGPATWLCTNPECERSPKIGAATREEER